MNVFDTVLHVVVRREEMTTVNTCKEQEVPNRDSWQCGDSELCEERKRVIRRLPGTVMRVAYFDIGIHDVERFFAWSRSIEQQLADTYNRKHGTNYKLSNWGSGLQPFSAQCRKDKQMYMFYVAECHHGYYGRQA